MTRSFKIPLGLAATTLAACGSGPNYIGTWDVDSFSSTYNGDTETYDFPYTYGTYTRSVDMVINETTLSIRNMYTYTDGTSDYTYTEGPYSWTEDDEARLSVTDADLDANSFICDQLVENTLDCTITFGPGDTVTIAATRAL